MKQSESLKELMPALIKAQGSIKHALKDAKNPHFKNQYATLESVIDATKEALLKNDISIVQAHTINNTLVTTLYHKSGEFLQSEVNLFMSRQDMQQLGSATTYARRYALASMLNIAQEDDDGNAAAKPENRPLTYNKKYYPEDLLKVPSEFVVDFGKKFKGKKIADMPIEAVDESVQYWMKQVRDSKQSLTGNIRAFVVNANEYLISKGVYPPDEE
jgi:hypothetical protein